MEANLIALRERALHTETVRRYDEIARLLTGSEHAGAAEGIAWVGHLCAHLRIPALRRYGITPNDFPVLVANASNASSMKANPIPLTDEEMKATLDRAL